MWKNKNLLLSNGVNIHPALHFQEVLSQYLWNGRSTLKIEESRLHFFRFWIYMGPPEFKMCISRHFLMTLGGMYIFGLFSMVFLAKKCLNMNISRTHLKPKLKNNCSLLSSFFNVERLFQRYWDKTSWKCFVMIHHISIWKMA